MNVRAAVLLACAACGGAQDGERTVQGRTEVVVERIPVASAADGARSGGAIDPDDPSTFPRGQVRVRAVRRWNGSIVAESDELYALDLAAADAHRLTLPGVERVTAVATHGGAAIALVQRA